MPMGKALALITTLLAVGLLGSQQTVPAQAQSADVTNLKGEYRRPPPRPIENQALVDLGRDLFFEPRISASGKTSCASCHFPQLGWAVTDARSRNDSGKLTSQIAAVDRTGIRRQCASRLGRPQRLPGSASQSIHCHRLHVDARD